MTSREPISDIGIGVGVGNGLPQRAGIILIDHKQHRRHLATFHALYSMVPPTHNLPLPVIPPPTNPCANHDNLLNGNQKKVSAAHAGGEHAKEWQ